LRWRHEDGRFGACPPNSSRSRRTAGLILAIGDWVLRNRACADEAQVVTPSTRYPCRSNVVPDGQLDEAGLRRQRHDGADLHSGLPGHALIIEIAESTLVQLFPFAHAATSICGGCGAATAYGWRSTTSEPAIHHCPMWRKLPVDIVKIDKSFTQGPPRRRLLAAGLGLYQGHPAVGRKSEQGGRGQGRGNRGTGRSYANPALPVGAGLTCSAGRSHRRRSNRILDGRA